MREEKERKAAKKCRVLPPPSPPTQAIETQTNGTVYGSSLGTFYNENGVLSTLFVGHCLTGLCQEVILTKLK